ncbi:hypothetical protein WA1_51015 [Scytonema hofmannii PCC 7110]|uniref:Carboxypeptidase regulatory-like domain-containing protein n=1 Tax=Scytonema hofmannii PCC 7110 TaxID=128403 RepID=A0A139WQ30_9CYAN|nr:carboxypeptidase-like regulatory domain-containing protein [Scytonema hofmannii]KYC34540.1 hypothetical protein WA1_51015 [Scytonema hofmannii PCC 7110]
MVNFIGRVVNQKNMPVKGATVSLEFQGTPPIVYTDSQGVYRFTVNFISGSSLNGRIRVEAIGYETNDRYIELSPNNSNLEEFRLVENDPDFASNKRPIAIRVAWITAAATVLAALIGSVAMLSKSSEERTKPTSPVNIPRAQTDNSSEITTTTLLKEPVFSTKETSSPESIQPNLLKSKISEAIKVGYDGLTTYRTFIKTFEKNGGSFTLGSPIDNVQSWENGLIQNFTNGSEERGAIIKSYNSDKAYWVGAEFWQVFMAIGGLKPEGIGSPETDRYKTNSGQRQNFERGAIFQSSRGIFPMFAGIYGYYRDKEGGETGRLGFPVSKEQGVGNGIHLQYFENGCIRYDEHGSPTRTIMNPNRCL